MTWQLARDSVTSAYDVSDASQSVVQVLNLSCNCLSFDFMGTIPDDTSDEQGTARSLKGSMSGLIL